MLSIPPKNLRLHWDAQQGWILDVPWLLPAAAVRNAAGLAVKKQIDRWRSLPLGEKKDELKEAIEKLQRGEVQQRVVGPKGDGKGDLLLFSGMRR